MTIRCQPDSATVTFVVAIEKLIYPLVKVIAIDVMAITSQIRTSIVIFPRKAKSSCSFNACHLGKGIPNNFSQRQPIEPYVTTVM